jgi:hypothetical protein
MVKLSRRKILAQVDQDSSTFESPWQFVHSSPAATTIFLKRINDLIEYETATIKWEQYNEDQEKSKKEKV